jgi:hypothetical protein
VAAPAAPDFRLRADSAARGAAQPIRGLNDGATPDAGALPFGQPQWRAGHDFAHPPAPDPKWAAADIQYMNRLANAAFELGTLEGWRAAASGTAEVVKGNGWGNAVSGTESAPTGTSKFELHLRTGGDVEQRVAGLRPATRYQLSGWTRVSEPAATVVLEASGFGGTAVSAACSQTRWTRLLVEFTTGPLVDSVTVRIRSTGTSETAFAAADNLGLIETPLPRR